ncbi:MAG: RlmE family RNA methyltransferase [Treponema sp.]|jgi:23S rRNA (uridine2552-2'-O)-methyltransferase|nr:RlmE family RNA methyltransferase [Treponema sp.]
MTAYEKLDFWSLKAQKEGYPARSVYKIREIDQKFAFFGNAGGRILDLGAAPGSWSLYVLRKFKPSGARGGPGGPESGGLLLAAADLLPLSRRFDGGLFDREDFFFIQGDFTQDPLREALQSRGPYTAVISDAAPATTGNRTVDTLRSLALAEDALAYAERCLAPGGNLVLKVFQGGDTAALLKKLREDFGSARSFKPAVCRPGSFETYYIGLGKKTS